jgi:AmiR/NasT family two-component response regulator
MQPFVRSDRLQFEVLAVSASKPIHAALRHIADSVDLKLLHESEPETGIAVAKRDRIPVVLVATDVDWRHVVRSLSSEEVRSSVVVLMPCMDPMLWCEALTLGAFDAIGTSTDRETLLATLANAYRRWERYQLVRAALLQNPELSGPVHDQG